MTHTRLQEMGRLWSKGVGRSDAWRWIFPHWGHGRQHFLTWQRGDWSAHAHERTHA